MIEIVCKYCTAPFAPKPHGKNLYCSAACGKRANKKQRMLNIAPTPCTACGTQFVPIANDKRMRFCTRHCYDVHYRNNNTARIRRNVRNWYDGYALKKRQAQPWANLLLSRARGAKKEGLAFDLTPEWAAARWTGKCELTDIPFAAPQERSRKRIKSCIFLPSLDKIIPKLGYTKTNSRFVLMAVNTFKWDGSDAQMYAIAEALLKNRKA